MLRRRRRSPERSLSPFQVHRIDACNLFSIGRLSCADVAVYVLCVCVYVCVCVDDEVMQAADETEWRKLGKVEKKRSEELRKDAADETDEKRAERLSNTKTGLKEGRVSPRTNAHELSSDQCIKLSHIMVWHSTFIRGLVSPYVRI